MADRRCLVFPDGDDWIVFAPVSQLALRANAAAAGAFRSFVDGGRPAPPGTEEGARCVAADPLPEEMTVYCTNQCRQSCVYCYGKPARANKAELDERLCRAAVELLAGRAGSRKRPLEVLFHGMGEPTLNWELFTRCVGIVRETGERHGVRTSIALSTGGQLSEVQAAWVAEHVDAAHISIDGPGDLQNLQRPRLDGRDALARPLQAARAMLASGRKTFVKTTVTNLSVGRMEEIAEFTASELAGSCQVFDMMFAVPWGGTAVSPPPWEAFVEGFGRALDRGSALGLDVRHAQVSVGGACRPVTPDGRCHFSIAPPDIVTAFHDLFEEGGAAPRLGAYGWYRPDTGAVHIDRARQAALATALPSPQCLDCPCAGVCLGPGSARGRIGVGPFGEDPTCRMKVGVLKELLRRAVPRQTTSEGVHA